MFLIFVYSLPNSTFCLLNSFLFSNASLLNFDRVCALVSAMDLDATQKKVYFGKNGGWWNGSAYTANAPSTGENLNNDTFYGYRCDSGSGTPTSHWNFGNGYFGTTAVSSAGTNASNLGIFEYDVPTGYKALCTKGLNT